MSKNAIKQKYGLTDPEMLKIDQLIEIFGAQWVSFDGQKFAIPAKEKGQPEVSLSNNSS